MKKWFIFGILLVILNSFLPTVYAKDIVIKNRLFSIVLPEEFKGFYFKKVDNNTIEIFDKASKKAGFGGFAFGIRAYKNPADHAALPGSKKLGELIDTKGTLYDIVLKHPTDVQYDYTKSTQAPELFKKLYDIGDNVNIQGVKGAKYLKEHGTKGEDLYKEVLQKHITAIDEKWDSLKLEQENMSYMYNVLAPDNVNALGYTYYDLNADGIDELLIGEITNGSWKGIIYDIYTMVNRKPEHVVSAGARNRFFVCDDVFLCNEYSSGALESGVRVYILLENSTELFPQVSFKYDGYANKEKPWFISYGSVPNDDEWDNVDEDTFNERKKIFDKYIRFDYTRLK